MASRDGWRQPLADFLRRQARNDLELPAPGHQGDRSLDGGERINRRRREGTRERTGADNVIEPEDTQIASQMAVAHQIPAPVAMDDLIGINRALGLGAILSTMANAQLIPRANSADSGFEMRWNGQGRSSQYRSCECHRAIHALDQIA